MFGNINRHILKMADALSEGIENQFPDRELPGLVGAPQGPVNFEVTQASINDLCGAHHGEDKDEHERESEREYEREHKHDREHTHNLYQHFKRMRDEYEKKGKLPKYHVVKPSRLGSKKSIGDRQTQYENDYDDDNNNNNNMDYSRALVPYVDPYKKAPWSDPNLWWYGGQNLYKYKPLAGLPGMTSLTVPLGLPPVLDSPVAIYSGSSPEGRCCAVDPGTGIRCIYSVCLEDICPACGRHHYCSPTHARYAAEVGLRLKYGYVAEKPNQHYYYCPHTQAVLTALDLA
jgi:hypothetical protein